MLKTEGLYDENNPFGARHVTALGCMGYEEIEKEEQGIYEIDDAKCKMGTVDIKLDKDYTVILISRY
jgi:hypothetical protein